MCVQCPSDTSSFVSVLRISKLEFLDEVEELELLLDHYCVAWGIRVPESKRRKIEAQPDGWAGYAGMELMEARVV